jgi:hypothetical protein
MIPRRCVFVSEANKWEKRHRNERHKNFLECKHVFVLILQALWHPVCWTATTREPWFAVPGIRAIASLVWLPSLPSPPGLYLLLVSGILQTANSAFFISWLMFCMFLIISAIKFLVLCYHYFYYLSSHH